METLSSSLLYAPSLTQYVRRKTVQVDIGGIYCGSDYPIRLQSMTTADTLDTKATVEECIRLIEAGSEYVRITAPGKKDAENLAVIRKELANRGYTTPLVADIHFTPSAAEIAARHVQKVRINPGNYVDSKKFELKDYTDADYRAEIERIRKKFIPLVKICKEYGTAMRIGTNHGSLSDRIMSRYGDTPLGMVESALEFLRIAEEFNYEQIVISMKASNARVMIQAYRLLVAKLNEEGLKPYPLHLGVTEAGEAEDGRIKSAVGIGTLLEDGLGDTIRVSLTEPPEFEIPVARKLAQRYENRNSTYSIPELSSLTFNPYEYKRRESREIENFGLGQFPRVIADLSALNSLEMEDFQAIGHKYLPVLDKWKMSEVGSDYVFSGASPIPFMIANGAKEITFCNAHAEHNKSLPLLTIADLQDLDNIQTAFLLLKTKQLYNEKHQASLKEFLHANKVVVVLETDNPHAMPDLRRAIMLLSAWGVDYPVIVKREYPFDLDDEQFMINASADLGGLFTDGLADGIWLGTGQWNVDEKEKVEVVAKLKLYNDTAFGILQAARTRMTRTEYISCPSCGRTLFDLPETTAMIRKRTDHLKGIKIGIMGCIVNGPGEMADADYGYVGSGRGKITLYRGKEVVKRGISSEHALDELIDIIKEDGNWQEVEEY